MFRKPNTRRQFLIGAGGFALSLPLLPSLLPKALAAGGRSRRFISIVNANGTDPENYWPDNISLSNIAGARRGTLTSVQGELSEILGAPFNSLKSKMAILHGLDRDKMETNYHGHNIKMCLTGTNVPDHNGDGRYEGDYDAWPSLDQVLANSPIVYPNTPALRDVHLVTRRDGAIEHYNRRHAISYKAVNRKFVEVFPENDPRVIFDRVFGANTQQQSNPQADAKNQKYQKVVDKVLGDFRSLRANRKISSEDLVAVDIHLEQLSQLEDNLISLPTVPVCTPGQRPVDANFSTSSLSEVNQYYSAQIDLMVSLIKCDLTNVITLMLNNSTDREKFTFLPNYRGMSFHIESHFGTSSGPSNKSSHFTEIFKWLSSKVAELATKLDTPEGGQDTFLDNSLIMATSSQGNGNHTGKNIPMLLLGSAGGRIRTNQYLRFDDEPAYNQILVTIAQAMGLSPNDYRQAGRPGFGVYRRSEYSSDSPLPGVLV